MCKKHYTHLSEKERYMIEERSKDGMSLREIAHRLGRSRSSISGEFRHNQGLRGYRQWCVDEIQTNNLSIGMVASSFPFKYIFQL